MAIINPPRILSLPKKDASPRSLDEAYRLVGASLCDNFQGGAVPNKIILNKNISGQVLVQTYLSASCLAERHR
jgi:hypothetical protein